MKEFAADLLELAEGLYAVMSADGTLMAINAAGAGMLGWMPVDLVGRPWLGLVHPEGHLLALRTFANLIAAYPTECELKCVMREGESRALIWRLRRSPDGQRVFAAARFPMFVAAGDLPVIEDLHVIAGELDLPGELERLARILDQSTDFFGIADGAGRVLYYNRACREALGISLGDMPLRAGCHLDYRPEWARRLLIEQGLPEARRRGYWHGETALLTKDGRELRVSQLLNAHFNEAGEIEFLSTVMRDVTAYRKLQDQHAQMSRQFYRAVQNTPGAFFQYALLPDGSNLMLYMSQRATEIYGLSVEELLGDSSTKLREMTHPDDLVRFAEMFRVSAETMQPCSSDGRIKTADGRNKWIHIIASPERQADGGIVWDGLTIDVTEQRAIEDERARLIDIIDSTPDLIAYAELPGGKSYANRALRLMCGVSLDAELPVIRCEKDLRAATRDVYPEWAAELITKRGIPAAIQGEVWQGQTAIWKVLPDGSRRETPVLQTILAHKDIHGRLQSISTIMRDVSGLIEQQLFVQRITESAPAMIFILRASDKTVLFSNRQAHAILGYTHEELQAMGAGVVAAVFHPDELEKVRVGFLQTLTLADGEYFEAEARLRHKEGHWIWCQRRLTVFRRDESGRVTEIIVMSEDITAKKALLESLEAERLKSIHASRMASLGEMAAGIAHEINNPLSIMVGLATQVRQAVEGGRMVQADIGKSAEVIETTGYRIAQIIRGLRNFARDADQDPFQSALLATIVEDVVALCAMRFRDCCVQIDVAPVPPNLELECRPAQIAQVLLNLLNNAYDAAMSRPERWVRLELEVQDAEITLAVCDSGLGVPEEMRARIMEPFFTTKATGQGMGLGLSISEGLIKAHHGRLYLDSASPHTRFVVVLPREQDS